MKKQVRAAYHFSQPYYDDGMDMWGETRGQEIWEAENVRISEVLDANGEPLRIELARHPVGFDLRGRK